MRDRFPPRRRLLVAAIVGSLLPCFAGAQQGDDWQTTQPAAAGFKADVADKLDESFRRGELPNVHAVVVVRGGKLVFERYYEGVDQFWAMPIGTVKFGPGVKHDLRSASKSVVGLLYGIALADKKVPGLDQTILSQFPAYPDLAADPQRRKMTVAHALSMTLGIEWPEDLPYSDAQNPELAMYLSTDPYRFILDHRMVTEPGTTWNYCGGATALLGHLIAQGTGEPLFQYAKKKFFDPLGIREVQWVGGIDGEVSAASGVRMRPRDFAKIGQLVLNKGRWGDRQVVPREWLDQVLTPHARIPPEGVGGMDVQYGYQWWLVNRSSDHPWFIARGNGGQVLFVVPHLDLVVAVMAGNYNNAHHADIPMAVLTKIVLPAVSNKH